MSAASVGDILRFVLGDEWQDNSEFLTWPPDVFAACGRVLQRSGAYSKVVEGGVEGRGSAEEWQKYIQRIGDNWRNRAATNRPCPRPVTGWWREVASSAGLTISSVPRRRRVWEALVKLCCTADAACAGVGIPERDESGDEPDDFAALASAQLREGWLTNGSCSLCRHVDPSRLIVLPKMHTPLKGMTMRSLTHHLALCDALDVRVQWYQAFEEENRRATQRFGHGMVVLIVPEPMQMTASQFRPSSGSKLPLSGMGKDFDFFELQSREKRGEPIADVVARLCQSAREKVGRVDAVVLPEMAVTPQEYTKLRHKLMGQLSFLCCGVYERPTRRRMGANYANMCVRMWQNQFIETQQHKHHRWFLDEAQICQYGLGATLDPAKKWWENTSLRERVLTFLSIDKWLVLTVLICEDLARPDPVANTIRAVGPNLVIALLQDGPQLANRWSARCATVLADDPGSSVLTVTSLGMSTMSRPRDGNFDPTGARVIALWKDKASGAQQILLPPGAQAMALSLTNTWEKEWSADGRHDGGSAGLVRISGIHPIYDGSGQPTPSH